MAQTPAQFLVESLVADALLLGEWGAQESLQLPDEAEVSEMAGQPVKPLSPADLRRQRDRERTKLTRESQRENIERMKVTVQTLTQQLDLLLKTQRPDLDTASEATKAYAALAQTEHRLKAEKLMLKSKLVQHQNMHQRLVDVFATNKESIVPRNEALAPNMADIAVSFPEFHAVSLDQADAAIASGYRNIMECESSAQPLDPWAMEGVDTPSHTFGWSLSCALRPGSFFYFAMTKKLDGVKACQAMQRSWSVMSRPHVTNESPGPSQLLAQSMLLQQLDSRTSVVGNDWHHPLRPGVRMRSISVRQCRDTSKGYDVVLGTLDPQDPEQRRRAPAGVEYLGASNWHSFTDEDDGSGCVATFKVLWRYDTRENLHLRLVNALIATWHWESGVTKNWQLLKL